MNNKRGHAAITTIKNKRSTKKRSYTLCLIAVMLIIGACVIFSLKSSAHGNLTEDPINYTYYKSIIIQPGDTLWNIADTYMPEEYDSVAEYVTVLKTINNLYDDDIESGQNLMIAYQDKDFI